MADGDLLALHGQGPHVNLERLAPIPGKPGNYAVLDPVHIYLVEP
jgi:hypothetical protein